MSTLRETINDELNSRHWTILDLASASNINPDTLYHVLFWKAPMTAQIAAGLAQAFGTSDELWINLGKAK